MINDADDDAVRRVRAQAAQLEAARLAERQALESLYAELRASAGLISLWGPRRFARAVGSGVLSSDVVRKVTRDARLAARRPVKANTRDVELNPVLGVSPRTGE
jgi:hypothetical protein